MRRMARSLLILSLLAATGCTQETGPGPARQRVTRAPRPVPPGVLPKDEPRVKRARAAVKSLKTTLKKALLDALGQGGPEKAIEVCSEEAQRLARVASTARVTVGRTSARLRNPRNAPRAWVKPIMAEYQRGPGAPPYRTVLLDKGVVGYVEPIYTARICLTCHGSEPPPSVAERIRAHYPEDRATGFKAGEIRGLFWAEVR